VLTPKGTTINRSTRQEAAALSRRALNRAAWNTISPVVKRRQAETNRRFTSKEVIRVSKVLQVGQLTNTRWNLAGKHVMRHIQLLQAVNIPNRSRQWPHQLVETHIKHRQIPQPPQITRQARFKPIIHEYNLVQILHIHQAFRHTAMEVIVRKHNHRHRRVAEVVGKLEMEAIMVDKNSVQRFIEEFSGHSAFKLVESQIQELQAGKTQNHRRKFSSETIVA